MQKAFGTMARRVAQRMEDLRAAKTLDVMKTIPAAHCHELKQDRKGQLAVRISGNYRIVFEPYEKLPAKNDDNSLNWTAITIIEIIEVIDYH